MDGLVGEFELFNSPLQGIRKALKNSRKYTVGELAELDKLLWHTWDIRGDPQSTRVVDAAIEHLQSMKNTLQSFESIVNHELMQLDKRLHHIKSRDESGTMSDYHPRAPIDHEHFPNIPMPHIHNHHSPATAATDTAAAAAATAVNGSSAIDSSMYSVAAAAAAPSAVPPTIPPFDPRNYSRKRMKMKMKMAPHTPAILVYPHSPSVEMSLSTATAAAVAAVPSASASATTARVVDAHPSAMNGVPSFSTKVLHSASITDRNSPINDATEMHLDEEKQLADEKEGSDDDDDDDDDDVEDDDDDDNDSEEDELGIEIEMEDEETTEDETDLMFDTHSLSSSALCRTYAYVDPYTCNVELTKRAYGTMFYDRVMVDYLLRNLCFESAKSLLINTDLGFYTTFDIYHHNKDVFTALYNRDIEPLLRWCRRNKSLLKEKKKSSDTATFDLEYLLRKRAVIELLKSGFAMEAFHYIKQFLSAELTNPIKCKEIQQLSALIACAELIFTDHPLDNNPNGWEKTMPAEVVRLVKDDDWVWQCIADEFWKSFQMIHGLEHDSLLEKALNIGLSISKSHCCDFEVWTHPQCITCKYNRKSKAAVLAAKIRPIQINSSRVICPVTNAIGTTLYLTPFGIVVDSNALRYFNAQTIRNSKRVYLL